MCFNIELNHHQSSASKFHSSFKRTYPLKDVKFTAQKWCTYFVHHTLYHMKDGPLLVNSTLCCDVGYSYRREVQQLETPNFLARFTFNAAAVAAAFTYTY